LAAVALALTIPVAACGGSGDEGASTSGAANESVSPAEKTAFKLISAPIDVLIPQASNQVTEDTFQPPDKANKAYQICVSVPTMQDPYWLAADYGFVMEARRLGVKVKIANAGSYQNLSKQVSDINDCVAQGVDAIVAAPISSDGLASVLAGAKAQGITVINGVNRMPPKYDVTARGTSVDYYQIGVSIGKELKDQVGDAATTVAVFPGAAGADFSTRSLEGFKDGIAGSNIKIVDTKFGDTGKDTQLNLVTDGLNAHPDVDWIVGNAVAADAAVGAKSARGVDAKIVSTYQTPEVRQHVANGDIEYAYNDNVVLQASMDIDLVVKQLNGEDITGKEYWVAPTKLTKENAAKEPNPGFAPKGFKPVFSVD
jgi:protein TorT